MKFKDVNEEKIQEAIEVLKEMEKLTAKFREAFDMLNEREKNLIGGMVIGIYSPIGEISIHGLIGHTFICGAMLDEMKRDHGHGPGGKQQKEAADLVKMMFPRKKEKESELPN